jgi:hypothetical protein
MSSKLRLPLKVLGILALSAGALWAGERAERDFWTAKETKEQTKNTGVTAFPGKSWVEAGPVAYGSYGGSKKDEWTGAFHIEASFRDWSDFFQLRLNGLLGIGGPAEGLAEAQVVLLEGLALGGGICYTERLETTGRFGLYVEDKSNSRRRAGLYLLTDKGGGIELSWPIVEKWSLWGDVGEEKDNGDKYRRTVLGLNYSF